ncbi:MAG: 2-amino-4-hydroxy-6-hydroxymethyldihydropteridine diphosphokinase [Sneathiella sp.]|nr:2-amino-4-hydroxy-6-hydroxymethyldihydropteridine diphosphokinase [Sneathiella sp.]
MIFIGLGANLMHPTYGEPINTVKAAVEALSASGLRVARQSTWYKSAPVPISDQPWFVNGVVQVETEKSPEEVLTVLHDIEREFGRIREIKWEARVLDLDLIDYEGQSSTNKTQTKGGVFPHPHMHERAFVLLPLAELEPNWHHPILKTSISELLAPIDTQQLQPILE